jgi:hypothetical protein
MDNEQAVTQRQRQPPRFKLNFGRKEGGNFISELGHDSVPPTNRYVAVGEYEVFFFHDRR